MCRGKMHLLGGISKNVHSSMIVYHPMTKKWDRIETKGCIPRYGHSVVEYEKNLIVFGGSTDYNEAYKTRECVNGIFFLSFESSSWQPLENKGIHIQPRKFHAGCIIGQQFLIHGGFNSKNKILDETGIYDFAKNGWFNGDFEGENPGFRAYHCIQTVLNPDQAPSSIFSVKKTRYLNVKVPGIYMFGGLKENGKPCNDLNILDLSSNCPK